MKQTRTIRHGNSIRFLMWPLLFFALLQANTRAADRLVFLPPAENASDGKPAKHIVLVSGDEEYRTEETMPMLAKILSKKHGFQCTVLFALGPDAANYIDSNNSAGVRGLESLAKADLMLIGTRFRKPAADQAQHITDFLNAGKPVLGIRTATHAFNGEGDFGGLKFSDFGLKILGETWVSHHGKHKSQGGRGVIESSQAANPILRGVADIFTPSDIYSVTHLTANDTILLRGAVTETLDPKSPNVEGEKNKVMQPLAWLHTYQRPNGSGTGHSFCTTAGASVDFVNEDLRRLVVNAALHLTGHSIPDKADVAFVDPFYPSFYGFIKKPDYWKTIHLKPEDFDLGKSPQNADPLNSPEWPFRDRIVSSPNDKAAPGKIKSP